MCSGAPYPAAEPWPRAPAPGACGPRPDLLVRTTFGPGCSSTSVCSGAPYPAAEPWPRAPAPGACVPRPDLLELSASEPGCSSRSVCPGAPYPAAEPWPRAPASRARVPWPDPLERRASGLGCSSTTECPGGRTQARAQSFEGSDVPHLPLLHTGLGHGALRQDQTRCLATAHPLADGASTDQPACATNR